MGQFKFTKTFIEGVMIIEPVKLGDDRGYFMETYNKKDFDDNGLDVTFVQDNQSKSKKGVLRGLHMQVNNPQGKLVRVIKGEVYDVAVDMRKDSDTFGKWTSAILSEKNNRQFYIPEGFAHGFMVLSDEAEFVYKCTRLYDAGDELGIRFDDPDIGIDWPTNNIEPLLSEKDKKQPSFKEALEILNVKDGLI